MYFGKIFLCILGVLCSHVEFTPPWSYGRRGPPVEKQNIGITFKNMIHLEYTPRIQCQNYRQCQIMRAIYLNMLVTYAFYFETWTTQIKNKLLVATKVKGQLIIQVHYCKSAPQSSVGASCTEIPSKGIMLSLILASDGTNGRSMPQILPHYRMHRNQQKKKLYSQNRMSNYDVIAIIVLRLPKLAASSITGESSFQWKLDPLHIQAIWARSRGVHQCYFRSVVSPQFGPTNHTLNHQYLLLARIFKILIFGDLNNGAQLLKQFAPPPHSVAHHAHHWLARQACLPKYAWFTPWARHILR